MKTRRVWGIARNADSAFSRLVEGELLPPPDAASKSSILPSAVLPLAKPENLLGFQPLPDFAGILSESPGAKSARYLFLLPENGIFLREKSPRGGKPESLM